MRYNRSIGPSYGHGGNRMNDYPHNELVPRTDDMFGGLRMPLMDFGGNIKRI